MKHQCLISSYAKDFVWLGPCLASLKKFSRGFIPPVVSVSTPDFDGARRVVEKSFPEATVCIKDGPDGKGNLRAQVSMMESDLLCPHADYIWLVGSDCLVSSTFTPEPFFVADQPVMLMNSYNHLANFHPGTLPWREGVDNALGFRPDFEYMRRLPLLYHREVFSATRAHIEWLHQTPFEDYVYSVGDGIRSDSANFSESNVLGAYAHRLLPGFFRWVNLDGSKDHYGMTMERFPNPMIQFWSHGGLDTPCDCYFNYPAAAHEGDRVPWNNTFGRTPRHVIRDVLGPEAV